MKYGDREQAGPAQALSDGGGEADTDSLSPSAVIGPEEIPEADEFELKAPKNSSKLLNQGTLLVLLLVSVTVTVIWVMRLSQGEIRSAPGSKEAEAKVDDALTKLRLPKVGALVADDPLSPYNIDNLFQDSEHLITMFSADQTMRQVPIEFIQRNPFMLPEANADGIGTFSAVNTTGNDKKERRRQQRREKLSRELAGLELQTVMMGRVPMAVISNDLVRVGHVMGSFTIKKIRPRSLDLEVDGQAFVLTMEQ